MILVLAHPADLAAKSFVAFAEKAGVSCSVPESLEQISVCVESDRNGMTNVMLWHGEENSPVHSILNRGLPMAPGNDSVGSFKYAETLAAWWTTLACFNGPVINRPTREGFIAPLDVLAFSRCGLDMAPMYITTETIPDIREPKINFHRTRNGELLRNDEAATPDYLPANEVVNITGYDPDKTFYAILAGDQWINPTDTSGGFSCYMADKLQASREILMNKSASFSLLVLQHHEQEIRLVQANPFPALYHYQHISDRVNQSLLNYLTS